MDISTGGKKSTSIFKQSPVCNGYQKLSELKEILKSGSYEPPLGYSNVDWFVNENLNLEKMTL